MRVLFSTVALAALAPLMFANDASAEIYAAGRIGMSDASVAGGAFDVQNITTYGGALGLDAGLLRFEGGVERGAAEIFPGLDASLTNVSATVLADVDGPLGLSLFGGVGVDYSMAAVSGFASANGDGTGWHFDAGASIALGDAWDLELRRRQYDGEVDLGGGDIAVEYTSWTLGVRRAF